MIKGAMVVVYLVKQGGTVSSHVQVSSRDYRMVRIAHGVHLGKVHSGKKELSCKPAKLS